MALCVFCAFLWMQILPASIEGIVSRAGSGEPLPGTNVTLGDPPKTVITGADGRFLFSDVAPGSYRLIATNTRGYVPAEYGQRSPTSEGIPLEVAAGQKITGIQLAMTPTASISGRIYDSDGEPLGRAQVQALRPVYRNGHRRLTIVQSVETNDRGEYRLFWLAPGRYYVSARRDIAERPAGPLPAAFSTSAVRITEPSRFGTFEQASRPVVTKRMLRSGETVEETSLAVYYPGVLEWQTASPVTIGAGTVMGGVDISVGIGAVLAHHIRGRAISGANGQPLARATVMAVPRTMEPDLRVPVAPTDLGGFFDISGAVAGSYILSISGDRESAMVPIDVANSDVQNVTVITHAPFKISGRFGIDGYSRSGANSRFADLRVARFTREFEIPGLPPAGPSYNPPPSDDGSFILEGVSPGDLRVNLRGLPQDAYVKSVRIGTTDVLDAGLHLDSPPENPLEIVIGANAGSIRGSAVNARQDPAPNRTVVLLPDVLRQRHDLYKSVSTDASGRFRISGITPGDYKLFAFEDVETGAWEDPDFLRAYEGRGQPAHVAEGSDEDVSLTVIP